MAKSSRKEKAAIFYARTQSRMKLCAVWMRNAILGIDLIPRATETKVLYVRFFLSNKDSTLLGNTADFFFAYGKRKLLFQPFKVDWLSAKLAAILARPKQPSDVTGCITLMAG